MDNVRSPEFAWQFIDTLLARLREPNAAEDIVIQDWATLQASMEVISRCLQSASPEANADDRDRYRARLQDLNDEIFLLERSLLKKRETLASERHQLRAAAEWNRASRLV